KQDPEQRQDRILDRREGGADIGEQQSVGRARRRRHGAGENGRQELVTEAVVTQHDRALLVLADGDEYAPRRRAHQRKAGHQTNREEQQGEIVACRSIAQIKYDRTRVYSAGCSLENEAFIATGEAAEVE